MDRQLACATFATVIPVLALGGFFTREYWSPMLPSRFGEVFATLVIMCVTVAEFVAILGTASTHPSRVTVAIAEAGAGAATFAMGIVAMMGVITYAEERRDREHAGKPDEPRE